jgi:tripeptidyl-peptidase-1
MVHAPQQVPPEWKPSGENVNLDERMDAMVGLKRASPEQLDKIFWEVSTPGSPGFLAHYSWEAMGKVVRPSEHALGAAVGFLASHGATGIQVAAHGDYITASLKLRDLESMTSGKFVEFVHGVTGRRLVRLTGGVQLPAAFADYVDTFTGLHGFPLFEGQPSANESAGATAVTPSIINKQYSIAAVTKSGKNNTQSIGQFQGQYVSPTDLSSFCAKYKPDGGSCAIDKFIGTNTGTHPGVESMLDVEYIMGVGQGIPTWVYSYPNFDFCADLLKWASDVASNPEHPYVVSLSYGSQKIDFCDTATIQRLSQDVQKLGAMGITVLIASGDDGSGGISRQGSNKGKLSPSFPASIPYALAIGSTWFQNGESGAEEAATQFGSGGGFSYDYPIPSYQTSQVKGYLAKSPKTGTSTFAENGRGTPDVSLLGQAFQVIVNKRTEGVGGTSASTPTWGAIISLLNEVCLTASSGAKTLGFVNPLLYQNPDAFTDITVGTNAIGNNKASGWTCTEGWDAATGLGTPQFDKLEAVVRKACAGSTSIVV